MISILIGDITMLLVLLIECMGILHYGRVIFSWRPSEFKLKPSVVLSWTKALDTGSIEWRGDALHL